MSRVGASITSLGNLFQDFTILIIIDFFLLSNLNLPSFSLKPILLSYHCMTMEKVPLWLSCSHLQVQEGYSKASPESSWVWTTPTLSPWFHRRGASALWSSLLASSGFPPKRMHDQGNNLDIPYIHTLQSSGTEYNSWLVVCGVLAHSDFRYKNVSDVMWLLFTR